MLYLNVIFRQLILDIYCNMIMNGIDRNDEKFASHYQHILIVKELQKGFGEMYFGSKKTILSDNFFITTNTRINNHMDAGEFDGFFHRRLLENPFKYNIIRIKTSDDDLTNWTISDYMSHYFGFKITDTMTCFSCHQNKSPNTLEYEYFIMSLYGI